MTTLTGVVGASPLGHDRVKRAGRPRVRSRAGSRLEDCGVVNAVRIERINLDRHDRSDFDCGDTAADSWLRPRSMRTGSPGVVAQVAIVGRRVVVLLSIWLHSRCRLDGR